jgi:Na+/proline symporter
VIWTDVVQMFIYVAGALVVLFALLQQVNGGWQAAVAIGEAAGKFKIFDFTANPNLVYTFWSGILGGVALTLATHGTYQFLVQRLLSARSARGASSGLILSGVIVFAQFALFLVIGVLLFAFYQQTPLPRPLVSNDEILPLFVVTSLSHGAAGFIVAAIVAAALSPSINALAATTVNDFYLKYVRPDADQPTLMRVSKNATIFWGVAQIGVAIGAQWIKSVLDTGLAVLSLSAGPVLGAFLAGVLTTRIGSRAMIVGMMTGIVVVIAVWWTAAAAWTWSAFIGSSVTFGTAYAASLVLSEARVDSHVRTISGRGGPHPRGHRGRRVSGSLDRSGPSRSAIVAPPHRTPDLRRRSGAGRSAHHLRSGLAHESHRDDDARDASRR